MECSQYGLTEKKKKKKKQKTKPVENMSDQCKTDTY